MDIMDDTESMPQYKVKEMLKFFKSSRVLSLTEINNAIESLPYGYADAADKPSPISDTTLDSTESNSLKQKGNF